MRKICDLSASLDGYKEELHPEFTSEANVFYTTIKNVNYPYKDEIGGVNRGSSDANRGSSANQNTSLVDIYGSKKRWRKDDLWATIQSFCATWHTPEDIALFIGKTPKYIKETVLPQMIKSGLLERLYPETPNHPKQKYRTTR